MGNIIDIYIYMFTNLYENVCSIIYIIVQNCTFKHITVSTPIYFVIIMCFAQIHIDGQTSEVNVFENT